MRRIDKGNEPEFFTDWKQGESEDWNPGWEDLDSSRTAKKDLESHLCEEQGAICCYCNRRLEEGQRHIEHFRPRDGSELDLEYRNLFLSCQNELSPGEPRHCGMAKGDWFDEELAVCPLAPDCEEQFKYFENGVIKGTSNAGDETARRLKLDIEGLQKRREAAIQGAFDELKPSDVDADAIRERIEEYRKRNPVTNNYPPFCSAIVSVLQLMIAETSVAMNGEQP